MSRYNRHIVLKEIGELGQQKISNSRVLVIGAGGLGCPILQYLAAAGVGTIGIVDFDVVELSNLQRQILFGRTCIGKNKAFAAQERLKNLNDSIVVKAYPEALTFENARSLFNNYDIIVDGTDNFATRYLINDMAVLTNKPLVYGAISKFEGQVAVFNYKGSANYRCLFPEPPTENIGNCSEVGVLGVLPGIIGTMQANEVLKIILGFKGVLANKIQCYDAITGQLSQLNLKKNKETYLKIINGLIDPEEYKRQCCKNTVDLSAALKQNDCLFIDVRDPLEKPMINYFEHLNIPLNELESKLETLPKNRTIYFFCKSGQRSQKARELLLKHRITSYVLTENASSIVTYFDK